MRARAGQEDTIKIRRIGQSDVDRVANLTALTFGYGNFPGIEDEVIVELEKWYADSIKRQADEKLLDFISRKKEASALNRELLLRRQVRMMKAALSPEKPFLAEPSPIESKQLERWRRARSFICLIAESQEDIVGSVNISIFQAQAALPAPFPSLAPWVLYISSLAVDPKHRRKGVGNRLLDRCEVIARRWGHKSIYLHCSGSNSAAISLYLSRGFELVDPGPSFLPGQLRQMLMKKDLPLISRQLCRDPLLQQDLENLEGGRVRDEDGVFIW